MGTNDVLLAQTSVHPLSYVHFKCLIKSVLSGLPNKEKENLSPEKVQVQVR